MKLRNQMLVFIVGCILLLSLNVLVVFTYSTSMLTFGILLLITAFIGFASVAAYIKAIELQRQREATERPQVAVCFKPQNQLIYCVVENLGNLPASNIKIRFQPSPMLYDGRFLQEIPLFAEGIPYLPPKAKYWRDIETDSRLMKSNNEPFEIIVQYKSTSGRTYTDKYVISLSELDEG